MNAFAKTSITLKLLSFGYMPDPDKLNLSDEEASRRCDLEADGDILWYAAEPLKAEQLLYGDRVGDNGNEFLPRDRAKQITEAAPNFNMEDAIIELPADVRAKFNKLKKEGWLKQGDRVTIDSTKEGFVRPIVLNPKSNYDPDAAIAQEQQSDEFPEEAVALAHPGIITAAWSFIKQVLVFTGVVEAWQIGIDPYLRKYLREAEPINKWMYAVRSYYVQDDYSQVDMKMIVPEKSDDELVKMLNSHLTAETASPFEVAYPWYAYAYAVTMDDHNEKHDYEAWANLVIVSEKPTLIAHREGLSRSRFAEYEAFMKQKNPTYKVFKPIQPQVMELINPGIEPIEFVVLVAAYGQRTGCKACATYKALTRGIVPGLTRIDLCIYHLETSKDFVGNYLYVMNPDYMGKTCLQETVRKCFVPSF